MIEIHVKNITAAKEYAYKNIMYEKTLHYQPIN